MVRDSSNDSRQVHRDPHRAYRAQCRPRQGETAFQVVVEHTDLRIIASRDLSQEAHQIVRDLRAGLKTHISLYPEFATSLTPLPLPEHASPLVQDMAEAAILCNVGPMAAVAGAVAQHVAEALVPLSKEVLVENGGDLYLASTQERIVGLLPDPNSEAFLGLKLAKEKFPVAVCASSATIGHSLSLGQGDLVVVTGKRAAVVDAAATALCNQLQSPGDLARVVEAAQELAATCRPKDIQGIFAQYGEEIAVWGDLELAAL
ncbi:MAG: UPF0280 family protein [Desulfovibrio sp.]|nr:MAG: UPF0280 family protein [Desulfovibrio sp.]